MGCAEDDGGSLHPYYDQFSATDLSHSKDLLGGLTHFDNRAGLAPQLSLRRNQRSHPPGAAFRQLGRVHEFTSFLRFNHVHNVEMSLVFLCERDRVSSSKL